MRAKELQNPSSTRNDTEVACATAVPIALEVQESPECPERRRAIEDAAKHVGRADNTRKYINQES